MPEISVIMGVYYRENNLSKLKKSVESILSQTLPSFEFLICDDGSVSEACAYFDAISKDDDRIRLIRPGKAYVLPEKLNCCLQYARGEWIARMDDDDVSHPERFEQQVHFLKNNPQIAFVGCNVNLVCEGIQVGMRKLPFSPTVKDFFMTQPYIHPALMFRKHALQIVNGYSEDKRVLLCEDYDLLLRMYEKGLVGANIQQVLLDYSVPVTEKGKRRMKHRWNEVVTRFRRFRALSLLPRALPYVIKPIAVGLIPASLRVKLRERRARRNSEF